MKGMAAEALRESTFLTQILTLNGGVTQCAESSETVFFECGCAVSTGLWLSEWKYFCVHVCVHSMDNCRVLQMFLDLAIISICYCIRFVNGQDADKETVQQDFLKNLFIGG